MAIFKACVRRPRKDGFWQIYIRVTHRRDIGFIKTDKMVTSKELTKNKEIKDPFVLRYCNDLIVRYNDMLNRKDVSKFTVLEVIDYLQTSEEDLSFSEYCRNYIKNLINTNHARTAKNYRISMSSLEKFFGTNDIKFSHLTVVMLNKWVVELEKNYSRAKEQYPVCMRQVFNTAFKELNDFELNIIRIKSDPWPKVKVPRSDSETKRAIPAEECRDFFSAPLPVSKMADPLPEFGRDIAKMILCLGGINTVDLYNLKKADFHHGIIHYQRAKTKSHRADKAYFEMRVEPILYPLFEKYATTEDDEYLFNFHNRFSSSDSFNGNVNNGIKKMCQSMGMPKENWYCAYTFRHTFGTIAQNDCGATIAEVGFAMNHAHGHKVTRGYLKLDFSPAWELNAKVIDFVFYSNKKSKQGKAVGFEETKDLLFRLSPKMMVYARAYFKGEVLAELTDIGFSNITQVIDALAKRLPQTIPAGATVVFRIKNVDSEKEAVYERTKGKGFK